MKLKWFLASAALVAALLFATLMRSTRHDDARRANERTAVLAEQPRGAQLATPPADVVAVPRAPVEAAAPAPAPAPVDQADEPRTGPPDRAAAVLTVQLVDCTQQPVGGVVAMLEDLRATTDAEGMASFALERPGGTHVVTIDEQTLPEGLELPWWQHRDRPGQRAGTLGSLHRLVPGPTPTQIVLPAAGRIEGTVHVEGEIVLGTVLSIRGLFDPDDPEPAGPRYTVDVDGRGRLAADLFPGAYQARLYGTPLAHASVRPAPLPFEVRCGETRLVDFDFVRAEGPGTLEIAVREPDGTPVPDAHFTLYHSGPGAPAYAPTYPYASVATDAFGQARLSGLVPGTYRPRYFRYSPSGELDLIDGIGDTVEVSGERDSLKLVVARVPRCELEGDASEIDLPALDPGERLEAQIEVFGVLDAPVVQRKPVDGNSHSFLAKGLPPGDCRVTLSAVATSGVERALHTWRLEPAPGENSVGGADSD